MSGEPTKYDETVLAGIELGGTKCICILARSSGEILAQHTEPTCDPDTTLSQIGVILRKWRREREVAALGIASFGPLELDRASPDFGKILMTAKPNWQGADLGVLADGLPWAIDTDVNGAALGEGEWGAAKGLDSWCYVTIGTGVGVAPVINRRPVSGLGHAEAGHMLVPSPDPQWTGSCPFHRCCVEGFVSGPAIAARCEQDAGDIADGHPVWQEVAQVIAQMCHNLALTVVPQRIILGGGIMVKRPQLVPMVRARLNESLAGYAHGSRILAMKDFLLPAGLGNDAGPLGAIMLARMAASDGGMGNPSMPLVEHTNSGESD